MCENKMMPNSDVLFPANTSRINFVQMKSYYLEVVNKVRMKFAPCTYRAPSAIQFGRCHPYKSSSEVLLCSDEIV